MNVNVAFDESANMAAVGVESYLFNIVSDNPAQQAVNLFVRASIQGNLTDADSYSIDAALLIGDYTVDASEASWSALQDIGDNELQ